jgi:hypothetical protein
MSPNAERQRKPRTWSELRQRVLEQDSLDVSELEHRKRRAHQMKYAIWLIPVALVGVAPSVIEEGVSWLPLVVIPLISYGAITSYWLGASWERRWDDLIREKSAPGGRD